MTPSAIAAAPAAVLAGAGVRPAGAVVALHGDGTPATPADLLQFWTGDPTIVLPIVVLAVLYARGVARLWERAGTGHGVPRWRAAAFAVGMATLAVALISPVDSAGEVLFSAHMVQHLLLMLVAAPLLVLGVPERAIPRAFPPPARRRIGRAANAVKRVAGPLARPGPAVAVATAGLWVWHLPGLYDLAVRSDGVHALEHATFLATAALFWWSLLHVRSRRADAGNGVRLLALFAMILQGSLLGALITFAGTPLYEAHASIPDAWWLRPLEDQQLAGLIMWVPPAALYLGVAAHLFVRWLRSAEPASKPDSAAEASPRRR